jgi:hypothetical protein
MRNVEQALAWLEKESKTPSQSWKGLCQSSARSCYGMPAWAPSAKDAWAAVGSKYKHEITRYDDKEWWASIPAGAIIYSVPSNSKYGHAWVAAGDMAGWSVDYKRSGFIDLVDVRLKGWNSYYQATKGWIDGCQWYADNQHRFKGLRMDLWDHKEPPYENVKASDDDRSLANAAVWRLSCRLADLGFGAKNWTPIKYEQTYPVKAMIAYNETHGPGMEDKSIYGPKAHERIFKKGQ